MEEIIKTTKGKTLVRIKKPITIGDIPKVINYKDKCYFVYEHTNGTEYWTRIIPAIFIKYSQRNKNYAVIKREDCKNRSRVPIEKVYWDGN